MSKSWFPVIDLKACTSCGACIDFCTHGVYEKTKAPYPVVVEPDTCIDHCHGCGNLCPTGAITYADEDTIWTPLQGKAPQSAGCGCGESRACGSETCDCGGMTDEVSFGCTCCGETTDASVKNIVVDFLYLDLDTCGRCMGADAVLDAATDDLKDILRQLGYTLTVNKVNIQTADMAEQYRFVSSPTIRVNGADICADVTENACQDCGDICGCDTTCRVFTYAGKPYDSPPKAMIMDGIMRAVYASAAVKDQTLYVLPENLKNFFAGALVRNEKS